jgi:hypothetical protein
MQIRLKLEPVYKPDLGSHFPRLAAALEELRVSYDDAHTTLLGLVTEIQRALYGDVKPALKETLRRHQTQLIALRSQVEEKIAAWKLEGLDELLYQLEDAFEALEKDLD